jgi:hypothetical protein
VTEPEAGLHAFELVLSRGSRAEVTQLALRPDAVAHVTTRDGALLCTVLPGPAYRRQAAAPVGQPAMAARSPSARSSGVEAPPGAIAGF